MLLEPAPRTMRGARDLLSVALQYGNAFGREFQPAALKPADSHYLDANYQLSGRQPRRNVFNNAKKLAAGLLVRFSES